MASFDTTSSSISKEPTPPRRGWASLRDLTGYQWFVFAVAAIAWMADCMDQQLFNLARVMSLTDLLGGAEAADKAEITRWAGRSTSIFLIGWATGGLTFGMFGDRIGRVRTLTLTILLYSMFTGLSALSVGPWDYCLYRFLTGLGVGGVFAAAVALLAETMPDNARPFTLGLMQALSAFGNCTAAGLFITLGLLELNGSLDSLKSVGLSAWRVLFLIGILPALLVIFIQRRLSEPESWVQAKAAADAGTGRKLGSYGDLFGGGWVTKHAILGMLLAFVGVVGLWGIGFFAIDLTQRIFNASYTAEAEALGFTGKAATDYIAGQRIIWAGITSLAINVGAFFGMSSFAWLSAMIGRKPAFAITLVAAAATVALVFTQMQTRFDIIWMNVLMGYCLLALFGGYAIYLPELFPTRLRATGTSFCYNVGRFIAASGPLALGFLTTSVFASASEGGLYPDRPFRYAGLAMCSVFALGLVVLPFLPETKDKPLPE
ncbi:MAG: MFS transporter [Bacteroidales bacterium]|nr:MFS transporter [Bacteroidales bacterium]